MHGIINDTVSTPWQPLRMQHTKQALAVTLKVLSEKYTFISLTTAVEILKKQRPPVNNALVITLDDGYLNSLTSDAPLFAHLNISPTIFVSTEHREANQPFCFDRLDYALQQITTGNVQTFVGHEIFIFNCQARKKLQQSYAIFGQKIKAHFKSDIAMRDYLCSLCQEIEQQTGKALSAIINNDPCAALADWQQLNYAKKNLNFEIGSHTLNHARLGLVDKHTASIELAESETKLNIHCVSFCYPDNSYNAHSVKTAALHYNRALTTNNGLNKLNCNLMTLKRFHLPTNDNPLKILFAISALRNGFNISQQKRKTLYENMYRCK
ncbi:hypothetical protein CXF72_18650 [Psychromonas sp. MB-3u-54]|uniref:polysaccharide deacetylase family protein n=1 Tax=Psychromonas sp. MB-3u-54 TaxID=2058319 RepID=UPI000C34984D|nr:polysaccharide deacetylase family protein [Psychromonas sp. MB-3u-54]PKH01058.1 hypothetical protein CXF72_18650 [Psychromonas sp. MB-3u-54]